MKLIVGLGNPGEKYLNTRHNIGFSVLDLFRQEMNSSPWIFEEKFKAEVSKLSFPINGENVPVLLAKPQTFMNNSGVSVNKLLNFYKVNVEDLVIVHDELDLPLGKIKLKLGGSAAGHHGVESVIRYLDNDKFIRLRLGIESVTEQTEEREPEQFVLAPFSKEETDEAEKVIKSSVNILETVLEKGIEEAQNLYH